MKNLTALKERGQKRVAHLVDVSKQQPTPVQSWGVTAASAVAGALAVAVAAKGVIAIVGTLAYPPIALTTGALGGGVLGWNFMQRRAQSAAHDEQTTKGSVVAEPIIPSADATIGAQPA